MRLLREDASEAGDRRRGRPLAAPPRRCGRGQRRETGPARRWRASRIAGARSRGERRESGGARRACGRELFFACITWWAKSGKEGKRDLERLAVGLWQRKYHTGAPSCLPLSWVSLARTGRNFSQIRRKTWSWGPDWEHFLLPALKKVLEGPSWGTGGDALRW